MESHGIEDPNKGSDAGPLHWESGTGVSTLPSVAVHELHALLTQETAWMDHQESMVREKS